MLSIRSNFPRDLLDIIIMPDTCALFCTDADMLVVGCVGDWFIRVTGPQYDRDRKLDAKCINIMVSNYARFVGNFGYAATHVTGEVVGGECYKTME